VGAEWIERRRPASRHGHQGSQALRVLEVKRVIFFLILQEERLSWLFWFLF
jgi:hypothetical protein